MAGAAIGRARGGRARAFTTTTLNKAGWLAAGISGVLIVSFIGPSQPVWWMIATYACFIYFGLRNLHFTGMVVLLIGMLMNLTPMIANLAVPVSEQALVSVGEVDADGSPLISGTRESTATATSFTFFGDVVPVPILNVVVSLGDLVIAVALADIAMHTMLREKNRRKDDDAVSFEDSPKAAAEIDLREAPPAAPEPKVKRNGPAHAASRRPRMKPLTIHVPAHAAPSKTADTPVSAPTAATTAGEYAPEHATPTVDSPKSAEAQEAEIILPPPSESVIVLNDQSAPLGYVTTADHVKSTAADNRPIIDLTNSPTEEQLMEFLRRRAAADQAIIEQAEGPAEVQRHPTRRRSRRSSRSNQKVDA